MEFRGRPSVLSALELEQMLRVSPPAEAFSAVSAHL